MADTIGTAYIQVEPEAKGIQSKIEQAISGGSQGFGSALTGALGTAAKVAGAALGGATAAIGAFGTASVNAGMSFDASMSQVAATMGKSVDEIGNLRDFAQEMGSTTAFSATEAADALNYMALAGYDADTSMKMLPNVLNLAAAGSIDLASASDMVTDAQTALGLSLDETSTMVDQMAKTSSISNTSVQQLGEAFLKIGANARNVKGGTQELSQVLGVLADNGIKGTEAGTHLRNIMLAMNPTTDAAAAAWQELGVSAYDADGKLRALPSIFGDLNRAMEGMTDQEKQKLITNMFNKTDLASVNALLGTSAERYGELARAIQGASVDVNSFKEAFTDLGGNFDQIESAVNALGDANLTNALPEYLEWCEGDAQKLAQAMYEDSNASISYDDIVNALGGDLDLLQQAFDNTGGAAEAMANTQLDNLQGDITLFKSALEGAEIAISDTLSPSLREFVQFGSDGLSKLTQSFKSDGLTGAMTTFGQVLSEGLNMIISKLPEFVNAGIQLLGALGQGLLDNLPMIVDAAGQIVVQLLEGIIVALPQLVEGAIQIVSQLATFLGEQLPVMMPAITEMLLNIVDVLIENIDLLIDGAIALILGLAQGLLDSMPLLIARMPELVGKIVSALIDNLPLLIDGCIQLMTMLATHWPEITFALIASIPEIIEAIVTAFAPIGEDLLAVFTEGWENIKEGFSQIGDWFSEKTETIKGIFDGLGQKSSETWDSMLNNPVIQAFITFVTDSFTAMKDTLSEVWENIKEAASAAWELIKNVVLGPVILLIDLITGDFNKLKEDAENIWNNIKDAASRIWEALKSAVVAIVVGFREKIHENIANLKEKLAEIWENVKEKAISLWTEIKEKVIEAATNLYDGVKEKIYEIPKIIKEKFNEAIDFIKDLPSQALQWGKDLIGNFIDGLKQKWNDLKSSLSSTAETIRGYLHFSEPDVGPLSDFHTYAPDMMALFARGITDNAGIVKRALTEATSDVMAMDYDVSTVQSIQTVSDSNMASQNDDILYRIENLLMKYLPDMNQDIYLDTGALVGATVGAYDNAIGIRSYRGSKR